MEDYEAAFPQRTMDVAVLDHAGRYTAAMHFGGIAIECLIKSLVCGSLPEDAEWDWRTHDYQRVFKCYNKLLFRVQQSQHVLKWLYEVQNPDGGPFIDMRYKGKEPDLLKYKHWWKSYRSLMGWLQVNGTKL